MKLANVECPDLRTAEGQSDYFNYLARMDDYMCVLEGHGRYVDSTDTEAVCVYAATLIMGGGNYDCPRA